MPNATDIEGWIKSKLDCEHITVYGPDEVHFEALVVSSEFEGLNLVKRHQLVYKTLGDKMQAEIHALAMKTLTPKEWEKANNQSD